ncbi:MAG: hypothetical protein A2Z72_08500 [Omnitrophica bacterium RBG_13_46_9]|nr:MAG: hypothetical protein A2Z72_08500 [Omnitrophica bacterium RBG_13_46_9]
MGKSLIIFGMVLIIIGIFFVLGGRISWFGRLPGDILISKKNFTFYFPITTCILISVALSVIFFLFFKR